MSYVNPDYKSKKVFKAAVARQNEYLKLKADTLRDGPLSIAAVNLGLLFPREPAIHHTYNPSGMFDSPKNGSDVVEGPHYPKPHRWCAAVTVENGIVVNVK